MVCIDVYFPEAPLDSISRGLEDFQKLATCHPEGGQTATRGEAGTGPSCVTNLQGYPTCKKTHPPRTLPQACA